MQSTSPCPEPHQHIHYFYLSLLISAAFVCSLFYFTLAPRIEVTKIYPLPSNNGTVLLLEVKQNPALKNKLTKKQATLQIDNKAFLVSITAISYDRSRVYVKLTKEASPSFLLFSHAILETPETSLFSYFKAR